MADSPKMPNLTFIIWKGEQEHGFHITERPYTKAVSPYLICCKAQDKNKIKDYSCSHLFVTLKTGLIQINKSYVLSMRRDMIVRQPIIPSPLVKPCTQFWKLPPFSTWKIHILLHLHDVFTNPSMCFMERVFLNTR
jgi:hypothetical protein